MLTIHRPAPPATKKRKTGPTSKAAPEEVSDDAEPEEDEEDVAAAPGESDVEEEDGEGDEENGTEEPTVKADGPTATAKKVKGGVVPKEADLAEVEGDEED